MRSTGPEQAAFLEVIPPARPSRLRGVSMAGFRDRGPGPLDMRAIPHPAVTLALEFGPGTLVVDDANGRRGGSVVAGLAFGNLRVRGRDIEAVQVRLSPIIAYTVLGTSPADLEGAVVVLDDLWGRDAARIQERLSHVDSWQDRFLLMATLLARRCQAGRSA